MVKEPETQKPSLEKFREEVRKRAEEIYKQRVKTGKSGDALSDWLKAEKYVKIKFDL